MPGQLVRQTDGPGDVVSGNAELDLYAVRGSITVAKGTGVMDDLGTRARIRATLLRTPGEIHATGGAVVGFRSGLPQEQSCVENKE